MARHRHDPFKDLVGFLLGDVMYAVRIEVVREIVNPLAIVDIPRAPPSVKGVADYRGDVVPVVDLRERFGLPATAATRKTKWVVLDVAGESSPANRQLGNAAPFTGTSVLDSDAPARRQTGVPDLHRANAARRTGPAGSPGQYAARPAGPPAAFRASSSQACYAALVVDSVTEVFGLAGGGLRPAPPLGDGDDKRGIEGVTTFGSRLVFVLDARAFGPVANAALSWAPGIPNASAEGT